MAGAKLKLKPGQFRLGFLVHDVSRLRRTVIDNALKPLDITRSQWWVLANLARHDGEPTMQTELAKLLEIGKVALGGLLDRLEASGYIIRRTDPEDRRAKLVEMSPAGRALLGLMQERTTDLNRDTMRGMTNAEILFAEDILHRMKIRLIEMNNEMKQGGAEQSAAKPRLSSGADPAPPA
jgi:DNA-binding MarR family transcriptional regulator